MSTYPKNEMIFRKANRAFYVYLTIKRFLKYVKIGKPDECWEWQGGVSSSFGYGGFIWEDKNIIHAHVASYVLFVGHRHGKCVLHKCDNPICVNPVHLWLGTHKDNMNDMVLKGRNRNHLTGKLLT